MSTDEFPLDFESLRKGDVVDQARIEAIYQVSAATDPGSFRLGQMKLVEAIEKRRSDLYPRTEGNVVRIMDDHEAEDYNGRRHRSHVKAIARDALRRGRIDRVNFSDAERRAAESRDMGFSALALMTRRALNKAEREARLLGSGDAEATDGE